MKYAAMPTKKEFKKQFGVGRIRRSLPEGSMHRISKLLEMHDASMLARCNNGRLSLLYDIQMHCDHALRHPHLSGIAGKQERIDSVKALMHSARGELCQRMKKRHFSDAKAIMARRFGISAKNNHKDNLNAIKYMNANERKDYLLHFFNGHVCMTDSSEDNDESILYDTDYEAHRGGGQNQLEHGGAPFVLSRNLRLYIAGGDMLLKTGKDFKHTSFMAGRDVLAAGTLRCEQGKLKWISAKSGHYQPTSRHMLTLLEFLRAKHINLQKVKFYRVFTRPLDDRSAPGQGEFDECNAMDFLNRRGFPGANPHSMFIDPPAA